MILIGKPELAESNMKKLIYLLFSIVLFCSCGKGELIEQPNLGGMSDGNLPEVIYASIADDQNPETRTYVAADKTVMWEPGDAVSFFYGNQQNARYVYEGELAASKVQFNLQEDGKPGGAHNCSRGIYPYNPNITVETQGDVDKIHVTYPDVQTYAQNSFGRGANLMIATGADSQDDKLYFRNACGYLVIKLYGKATVKSITLSAVDGVDKIAGEATIVTDGNNIPMPTMSDKASSYVTLDCSNGGKGVALGADKDNPTEFWFALPPVNFEDGIKIVVTDMNGNLYTKQTTKAVNITRNNVQPMAALEFVSNTPASNKIWYTKVADAPIGTITFGNGQANPFDATIIDHRYDSSVGKYVIEFDRPVKTIKAKAFNKTAVRTIVLPDGLETIEEQAFGETQLPSLTIPGSVNTIKKQAFSTCGLLKSVEFLPSPTQTPLSIVCTQRDFEEYGPFENASFTSINLNRELVYVDSEGESFTADEADDALFYNRYPAPSVSVTIGGQVRTIHDYMFSGLKFSSLTIPGTVTTIGDDVFNGCKALTNLTFGPSPTRDALTIGWNTDGVDEGLFVDCPLQTVNLNRQLEYAMTGDDFDEDFLPFAGKSLGDGVTLGGQVHTLLPYMFYNSGITSLKIPATVREIKDNAFYNCKTLASVRFEASSEPLTIGFQPGTDERGPFFQSPLTNIYVNRELVASESYAAARDQWDEGIFSTSFYGDDDPKVTVTLQGNVKTISDYMFSGVQMETIWIPREVETICKGAFYYCSRLYGMTLAHSGTFPTLIEEDYISDGGGAFKWTLLNDPDVQMRWIALEDGSDENVRKLKGSSNWSYYAYIIKAQIKNNLK